MDSKGPCMQIQYESGSETLETVTVYSILTHLKLERLTINRSFTSQLIYLVRKRLLIQILMSYCPATFTKVKQIYLAAQEPPFLPEFTQLPKSLRLYPNLPSCSRASVSSRIYLAAQEPPFLPEFT